MSVAIATLRVLNVVGRSRAEFERDLIRERVKVGMERARSEGTHVGRPPTLPIKEIRRRRRRGDTPTEIARELEVSRASVYRVLKSPHIGL